jgi:CubicO group peptidase (beta-lactamase class C family)
MPVQPPKSARQPAGRAAHRRAVLRGSLGLGLAAGAAAFADRATPSAAAQDGSPVPQTVSPPAAPAGTVTAERVALAVDLLPTVAEALLADSGVPGLAVAVVHDDAVVFSGGFGVREVGTAEPIDADTVFQLASVSKSLAATVVAAVVGEGTVAWDSRMADVDPGFALKDPLATRAVTLADLFSHRSGLPDHAGDILEDLGFPRDEIIHRLRFLDPAYSFRAGYEYTNFGLTAAAFAAATAAGTSWEELSDDRLYRPLGMERTSSRFADYMARDDRAIPHVQRDGRWVVTPMQRDPDPEAPAGGVSSSVNDMARWVRLMLGQGTFGGVELIPAAALAPVHLPQAVSNVPTDPATQRAGFYGLGTNVSYTDFGKPQWGHSGAFALGAGTAYYLLPAAGFGVVALTNGAPVGAAEAFALSVLDLAQLGAVSRDWFAVLQPAFAAILAENDYNDGTDWSSPPADAVPALPAAAYAGIYRNDVYGDVEVVAEGDGPSAGLVLRIGPTPLEFPMRHFDRDTFSWQPVGENAYGPSGLSFTVGPDNRALAFRDEYLAVDGEGAGLLERVAVDGDAD